VGSTHRSGESVLVANINKSHKFRKNVVRKPEGKQTTWQNLEKEGQILIWNISIGWN